jgi:hypothetical protein
MEIYTVKEASKITGISPRTIQFRCKRDNVRKKDNKYLITDSLISLWIDKSKEETQSNNATARNTQSNNGIEELIREIDNDEYVLSVLKAIKEDKHLEQFSDEELQKFNNRLKEADYLENRISEYKKEIARMEDYVLDYRNNIEYLKKSLDKRSDETAILLKSIEQRTYIEAREKKLDHK